MGKSRRNNKRNEAKGEAGSTNSNDFAKLANLLANQPTDPGLILCIPVWGWIGDGKTTAILTAQHFMDARQHGLGLHTMTYTDDLEPAEARSSLSLKDLAKSTKEHIDRQSKRFFDENQWPSGTDASMALLFKIASKLGSRGLLFVPDLPGGSFQEALGDASGVLQQAHGLVLLVDPVRYQKMDTEGKNYRHQVSDRLSNAALRQLPVAILITKCDDSNSGEKDSAFSLTQIELAASIEAYDKSVPIEIFPVSVIGIVASESQSAELPSPVERKPERMVYAWCWIITQALCRSTEGAREIPLNTNLASLAASRDSIARKPIVELRLVGSYSDCPGHLIGVVEAEAVTSRLIVLGEDGDLFHAAFADGSRESPKFVSAGKLEAYEDSIEQPIIQYNQGYCIVSSETDTDQFWYGRLGDSLGKSELPFKITGWAAVPGNLLIGLNTEGKLNSFQSRGGKWSIIDYYQALSAPIENGFVRFLARDSLVISGGSTSQPIAIELKSDGTFGAKRELGVELETDSEYVYLIGEYFVSVLETGEIRITGRSIDEAIGKASMDPRPMVAAGVGAARFAFIDDKLRIRIVTLSGAKVELSPPEVAPVLNSFPMNMYWFNLDGMLGVSSVEEELTIYKLFGVR